MKLFKFPTVASDALDGGSSHVDITTLQDLTVTATTFVMSGLGWTLTFTTDGENAAESLLNAQKLQTYFLPLVTPYIGDKMNRKEFNTVKDIWAGLTIAQIHTETGMVNTTTANEALATIALT